MKASDNSGSQPIRTRFLVVHNPSAGPAARHLYRAALSSLGRLGARVETIDIRRHSEGTSTAAEAAKSKNSDAVVAAGGDGTVHDVAEGLVGYSMPMGVIPMGTGNVFAKEIGLPRSSDEVARMLMFGRERDMPVGLVNGRPFLFVIGVGFVAEAVRLFESEGTRELGQVGFVWPVLRALVLHEDRPLHIRTDRGEAEAHWVIVTRVKYYAGNLLLAPNADPYRPDFHVVRIKGSGALKRVRQLAALALGVINHDPAVRVEPATQIRIDGDRAVPVQIDGEMLGELPLEISLHPKRLNILLAVA